MNAKAVEWHRMLMSNPERADQCDWDLIRKEWSGDFGRWYWDVLLMHYPQFADYCDWSAFDATDIGWILGSQPSLWKHVDLAHVNGDIVVGVAASVPECLEKCDTGRFTSRDWVALLRRRPEFRNRCDFTGFTGTDWVALLIERKEFSDVCDWTKLTLENWQELLFCKPEFRSQLESKTTFSYEECRVDEFEPF